MVSLFERLEGGTAATDRRAGQTIAQARRSKSPHKGRSSERTRTGNPRRRTRCGARVHQETTQLRQAANEGCFFQRGRKDQRPLVLGSPTTRLASRHSGQHLVHWALRSPPSRFIGPIAGRPCPLLGDERKGSTSLPREPRLICLRVNHRLSKKRPKVLKVPWRYRQGVRWALDSQMEASAGSPPAEFFAVQQRGFFLGV